MTLHDLHIFLRRVVTLNFSTAIWVEAEIGQIQESRGHYYLELIEEQEQEIVAKGSAMIWGRRYRKLRREKGKILTEVLKEGMKVKIQVQVEFSERYGLQLIIEDIDTTFTLGALALERQKIIATLQRRNLLSKNKQHSLPKVLQRIAVISSETAAGFQDYVQQLENNLYGYAFQTTLFPAAMQGAQTASEVVYQLDKINAKNSAFDAVVIIRGGGSKLDLAAFDSLVICEAVANMRLPVLVGIGHDIDETVLDLVAHSSLKTPTAVAEFLINHNLHFESELNYIAQQLQQKVEYHLQTKNLHLNRLEQQLELHLDRKFVLEKMKLEQQEMVLKQLCTFKLEKSKQHLALLDNKLTLLNPQTILNRGYAIIMQDGKRVTSKKSLKVGEVFNVIFKDGEMETQI